MSREIAAHKRFVRHRKKERRELAKSEERQQYLRERACFWTWPLGHVYVDERICVVCSHDGRPCLVD